MQLHPRLGLFSSNRLKSILATLPISPRPLIFWSFQEWFSSIAQQGSEGWDRNTWVQKVMSHIPLTPGHANFAIWFGVFGPIVPWATHMYVSWPNISCLQSWVPNLLSYIHICGSGAYRPKNAKMAKFAWLGVLLFYHLEIDLHTENSNKAFATSMGWQRMCTGFYMSSSYGPNALFVVSKSAKILVIALLWKIMMKTKNYWSKLWV